MLLFLALWVIAGAAAIPLGNLTVTSRSLSHLHPNDYLFMNSNAKGKRASDMPGFHYIFVDTNGYSSYTRGATGTQIEIAGSPASSSNSLLAAADIIAKMTRYMPEDIFTRLATYGSVGIFTAAEKLTVFPEFYYLRNGDCGTSCSGSCSQTCTFDGRKYEDIAGVGAQRCVVLEDNLLCTAADPYNHIRSILAHEFTHTIHQFALPDNVKQQVTAAYNTAKAYGTWDLSSYAMSNELEYLAEGGSSYFFVDEDNYGSGGMENCNGYMCASESQTRELLRQRDPGLYNVLSYIFTDNRPNLQSGLTICPSATIVG